jgi:hypothetical protein
MRTAKLTFKQVPLTVVRKIMKLQRKKKTAGISVQASQFTRVPIR